MTNVLEARQKRGPLAVPSDRGYYIHIGTTNETFLKTARDLRARGVKHNKFMLALYDKTLAGVDPRRNDLDDQTRGRILAECIINPWYFWREVVTVPVPGGTSVFELHLGNCALLWCMSNNINSYTVLPRQNYKTVSTVGFYLWAYCLGTSNSHFLFFNKSLDDSKNNLKRLKAMMDELPRWIREGILEDPIADLNNIEFIESGHRSNRIDAKAAGTNPVHADKQGRGATVPFRYYDELAFMAYIEETWMAAAPAGSKADEIALKNGKPHGTAITTTPNMIDDPSGEFAWKLKNGSLPFRVEFYDLGPKRVKQLVEAQAEFSFVYIEYNYKDLGHDEVWFNKQCRELLGNRIKIKREILLEWPMSSDSSVFDEDSLDALKSNVKPYVGAFPIRSRSVGIPAGLELHFIEPLDPNVAWVLGVDPASGVEQDYTSFCLTCPVTERPVAYLKTNTADDAATKEIFRILMEDMFPHAVAVIEMNHYLGHVLVNYVRRERAGLEGRLFYLMKDKKQEKSYGPGMGRRTSKVKTKVFGITMSPKAREGAMRHLVSIVEDTPEKVPLEAIQVEIRGLMRRKTGKIEHRAGAHDDVLFSWLLAVMALRHEQPVMSTLLRSVGGARKGRQEMTGYIHAVNEAVTEGDGESPVHVSPRAGLSKQQDITHQEYVEREVARRAAEAARGGAPTQGQARKRMADMVVGMNSFGPTPD